MRNLERKGVGYTCPSPHDDRYGQPAKIRSWRFCDIQRRVTDGRFVT